MEASLLGACTAAAWDILKLGARGGNEVTSATKLKAGATGAKKAFIKARIAITARAPKAP